LRVWLQSGIHRHGSRDEWRQRHLCSYQGGGEKTNSPEKNQKQVKDEFLLKAIAQAIKDAVLVHENSWDARKEAYSKEMEECFKQEFGVHKLPDGLWYPFYLASHWINDVVDWADHIAAHGNLDGFFSTPSEEEDLQIVDEHLQAIVDDLQTEHREDR